MHSPISTIVCAFVVGGFASFGQPSDKVVRVKKTAIELEAKLMAQFKAFAIRKRDYAKKIAAEKKVKPPEMVWKFFDSAIAGNYAETQKQFRPLALMSGQYDAPPPLLGEAFWAKAKPRIERLFEVGLLARWRESIARRLQLNKEAFDVVWVLVNEVQGAMEVLDSWHADYLQIYTENIVQSIPRNAIYFGGTDPGRYAITLGSKSHEKADPFFTITQNALADGRYLQYLRQLFGKRIYIPSVEDNQNAFRAYLKDARKRMMANQLAPDEQVTLIYAFQCPVNPSHQFTAALGRGQIGVLAQLEQMGAAPCRQCQQQEQQTMIPLPEPRVSVGGNTAVSAINARLAKMIFDQNPDHDFYLEESFALDWMKPHMVPHGLIFKLERKPLKELPPDLIDQNRKDWQKYMALCVGGEVVKPETSVAELCKWVETIYIKGKRGDFKGDAFYLKGKKEVMEKTVFRKGPPFSEQKAFSKMRSAQADVFTWRESATTDPKMKAKYAKEADYAYCQAFALGPINPEVAFKFLIFLTKAKRFEEAKIVLNTFAKTEVDSNFAKHMYRGVLVQEELHWVSQKEYAKAIAAVQKMVEIDGENKAQYFQRIERYKKLQ